MRRLWVSSILVSAMLAGVLATTQPAGGVAGFGDIHSGRFHVGPVQWMVDNKITTGTTSTCFSPDEFVTRGQAAAFMWRMEGSPGGLPPHTFTDVIAPWQQEPVSWMLDNAITTGTTPSTYSPDESLTRGQLAALLHRLEGSPSAPPPSQFIDVVKSWQVTPVGWMLEESITTGTSPSTFSPEDNVTRGQLAAFFYRYKGSPPVIISADSPQCDREIPFVGTWEAIDVDGSSIEMTIDRHGKVEYSDDRASKMNGDAGCAAVGLPDASTKMSGVGVETSPGTFVATVDSTCAVDDDSPTLRRSGTRITLLYGAPEPTTATGAAAADTLVTARDDNNFISGMPAPLCFWRAGRTRTDCGWPAPSADAPTTEGLLLVLGDTVLAADHRGQVIIGADNVILDCGGHTLFGDGTGIGIDLTASRTGVEIKNCVVWWFHTGINIFDGSNLDIHHNWMVGQANDGIRMGTSDTNVIRNNVFVGGRQGIIFSNSDNNTISSNVVSMTHDFFGIGVGVASTGNTVDGNRVYRSGANFVVDGSGNTLTGNVASEGVNGFHVGLAPGAAANTLTGNIADDNSSWGIRDDTSGAGTAATANTYASNSCSSNATASSSPTGLC